MTLHFSAFTVTVPMGIGTDTDGDHWTIALETPHGVLCLTGTAALPLLKLRGEIDDLIRALGYEREIA